MSAVCKRHLSRQRTKKSTGRFFANRSRRGRLRFEELEQRQLLSLTPVTWVGGNGNDWDVAANWSPVNGVSSVPNATDAVTINLPSATTVTINSGDNENIGSLTTGSTDTLSITGGSLTIAGSSTLGGPLTMTGGYLEATGSGVTVTVNGAAGTTTVSEASLYAEAGATLSLPNLTKSVSNGTDFQAEGAKSVLDVSALTTLTQNNNWTVNSYSGGEVKLTGLTSLTSTHGIYFNDSGDSTIVDNNLTSLTGVNVNSDGSDTQLANSWKSFESGQLTVTGGSYTLSSLTDVNGSNLYAESGGSLTLPDLLSPYVADNTTFEATGSNTGATKASLLDVSSLTKVTENGNWSVDAYNGGDVELTGLTSLTSTSGIYFNDSGDSTIVDNNLTSLTGVNVNTDGSDTQLANSWKSFESGQLTVTGGSYNLTGLTNVNGSNLYAESGGSLTLPDLIKYVSDNTTFEASGSNTTTSTASLLDVSALTTVTQSGNWSIDAYNGGGVELTGLTSLTSTNGIYLNDTGGSMIQNNLTSLTGVDVANTDGSDTQLANSWESFESGSLTVTGGSYNLTKLTNVNGSSLYAESGGGLTLPDLTKYESDNTTFEASGSNTGTSTASLLDVSALTTLTQSGNWSVDAYNGGDVNLTGLTSLTSTNGIYLNDTGGSMIQNDLSSLTGVDVANTDGSDTQLGNSWESFESGSLTVTGGSYNLTKLTNVNGSTLIAQSGGGLTLPDLTKYESDNTTFEASGSNTGTSTASLLDVSALTTLTQSGNWSVDAYNGGEVQMTGLTSLTSTDGIYLNDTGGSMIQNDLTSLTGVNANTDGSDTQLANSWKSFESSQLTVTTGSLSLPAALTNVNGSTLVAQGGGSLTLPGVTAYESDNTTFEATGSGSVLDLPDLATLTQAGNWSVDAYSGGEVELPALTSLTSTNGIYFNDTGSSTILDGKLTSLTGVSVNTDGSDPQLGSAWQSFANGNLTITGGAMTFPDLTDFSGSNLQLSGGATLSLPVLTEGNITLSNTATAGTSVTIDGTPVVMPADGTSGATINVPSSSGLTVTLEDSGTAGGLDSTTFNVGQGSTVVLSEGTYIGTTTFNVAQGAAVDLGGSQRPTFGGTLTGGGVTGAGIGTVQLNGYVNIGLDGLTLNFSGSSSSMFQWMGGGGMFASDGTVTNLGTLNLVGSTDMGVYEDTTLDNFGTMIQTGTGNLTLHSDNVTATTLMIEPGASYLIESDSGIDNEYGGVTSLVNEGTIRKTAGTGTSQLLINAGPSNSNIPGIISNTGTIEADSGTLYLDVPDAADITQVSGNTLTGGTWNALDGATIEFPSGTSITTNAANVTLSGAGAGFNTAGGTSALGGGALTNSGSLTLGTGSCRRRRHAQRRRRLHADIHRHAQHPDRRHAGQRFVRPDRCHRDGNPRRGVQPQFGERLRTHQRRGLPGHVLCQFQRNVYSFHRAGARLHGSPQRDGYQPGVEHGRGPRGLAADQCDGAHVGDRRRGHYGGLGGE